MGDTPSVSETCTAYCDVRPGPDACAFDRCACTTSGTFCGSSLPANCSYDANAIYTCAGDKALPQLDSTCPAPQACLAASTGPICTPVECICKDDASHCGSTFASTCNLASNTLYKCTTGGLPTATQDCGPGICSANIVTGTAAYQAMADDRCIDQCACKIAGVPVRGQKCNLLKCVRRSN